MFDPQGRLTQAEPADGPLAAALRRGEVAELSALVLPVLHGGTAQIGAVQIDGADGVMAYDLTALPLDDGGVLVLGRDVTLHHNLRAALVESRQRYKDFVEISSDFAWETGGDGTFVFVSPRGALGHAAADLVGRDPADLVLEREAGDEILPFHTHSAVDAAELWLRCRDGAAACVRIAAKPIYARDGRWMGARGVCRDVTRERERDAQLSRARNRERILNHIVRTFRDEVEPKNMLQVAAETVARGVGAAQCHIFRRQTDGEVAPHTIRSFVPAARHGDFEFTLGLPILDRLGDDDELIEMTLHGYDVLAAPTRYHHAVNGCIVLWRGEDRGPWGADDRLLIADIADQIGIANEQIAAHENIVRISRTDGLTSLFNRRAFFEELNRRFQRLLRDGSSAALMYVDLDNFKMVNDIKGHAAGDAVLCAVRDLLITYTRPTDLVARLGGDEFAIWLEGADALVAEKKARVLLDRALEDLAPRSGSPDHPLSLSIGVAVYQPGRPESMDALIARADSAMYTIKRGGKGSFALAPPAEPATDGPHPGEAP
ncbi:diguanylate cyclase domain-containing protein [Novispirillum sp. DQ9]|uniref:sensor domain-containing diguanylate cyclase n=1 Tax=Novispirillum sp. DQ9 TaxID=3398612 RepID=UPI003C7B8135